MNLQSLFKMLLQSQKLPMWLWIAIGLFSVVIPPAYDFLNSNGVITPNWTTVLKEVALWLVGVNPFLNKSNSSSSSGKTFTWIFIFIIGFSLSASSQNYYQITLPSKTKMTKQLATALINDKNIYPWVGATNRLGESWLIYASSSNDAKKKLSQNRSLPSKISVTLVGKDSSTVNSVKLYYPHNALNLIAPTENAVRNSDTHKRQLNNLYSPNIRRIIKSDIGNIANRDCFKVCSECSSDYDDEYWCFCVSPWPGICFCACTTGSSR